MLNIRELNDSEMAAVVGGGGGGVPVTQPDGNQYYCARISGDGAPLRYEVIAYNVNTGATKAFIADTDLCHSKGPITASDFLNSNQIKSEFGSNFQSRLDGAVSDTIDAGNRINDQNIIDAIKNIQPPSFTVHDTSGLNDGDNSGHKSSSSSSSSSHGYTTLKIPELNGGGNKSKVGVVTVEDQG